MSRTCKHVILSKARVSARAFVLHCLRLRPLVRRNHVVAARVLDFQILSRFNGCRNNSAISVTPSYNRKTSVIFGEKHGHVRVVTISQESVFNLNKLGRVPTVLKVRIG